jgi:tetratricopeptide (TPR) repeat protein
MRTGLLVLCLAAGIGLHAQSPAVHEVFEKVHQRMLEGDIAGSLELAARALRTQASALTPADSGALLWLVASVHQFRGEADEAAIRYRASISALERAGPDLALLLARARMDYAKLLVYSGTFAEAERLEAAGLAVHESVYPANHPDLLFMRAGKVLRLREQGQYGQAEALARDIITRWEAAGLPRNLELARLYDLLARVLLHQGKAREAARWYEQSLRIVEALCGDGHPFLLDALIGRAGALIQDGEFAGAEELLDRAETIILARLGREHPVLGVVLKSKCSLLQASGRKAEARRMERRFQAWMRESARMPNSVSWAEWTGNRRP